MLLPRSLRLICAMDSQQNRARSKFPVVDELQSNSQQKKGFSHRGNHPLLEGIMTTNLQLS